MIIQIVRFKSSMTYDEILEMSKKRAPRYRALSGLVQKYYLHFADTEEFGAVYVWDSEVALREFEGSELRATIPTAYAVQGTPDVRTGELALLLRPEEVST